MTINFSEREPVKTRKKPVGRGAGLGWPARDWGRARVRSPTGRKPCGGPRQLSLARRGAALLATRTPTRLERASPSRGRRNSRSDESTRASAELAVRRPGRQLSPDALPTRAPTFGRGTWSGGHRGRFPGLPSPLGPPLAPDASCSERGSPGTVHGTACGERWAPGAHACGRAGRWHGLACRGPQSAWTGRTGVCLVGAVPWILRTLAAHACDRLSGSDSWLADWRLASRHVLRVRAGGGCPGGPRLRATWGRSPSDLWPVPSASQRPRTAESQAAGDQDVASPGPCASLARCVAAAPPVDQPAAPHIASLHASSLEDHRRKGRATLKFRYEFQVLR